MWELNTRNDMGTSARQRSQRGRRRASVYIPLCLSWRAEGTLQSEEQVKEHNTSHWGEFDLGINTLANRLLQ